MGVMGALPFSLLLLLCTVLSPSPFISSDATDHEALHISLPTLPSFHDGFTHLWGDTNLMVLQDGKTAHLSLDERSGSGFISHDIFHHGLYSASIKLPSDYTAGVIVAFYMSNDDMFPKTHDELDFEFMGNIRGKQWRVQTNVFGNGTSGREERYDLWFDPTEDFHQYSILWTSHRITFYIDGVPVRDATKEAMGGSFPSKPMSAYATIWDGSGWATSGGRFKVLYKYAPYVAEFTDFVLHGCAVDPTNLVSSCSDGNGDGDTSASAALSAEHRLAMGRFRTAYMTYSYCHDRVRHPVAHAECSTDRREAEVFNGRGERMDGRRRRRERRRQRRSAAVLADAAL